MSKRRWRAPERGAGGRSWRAAPRSMRLWSMRRSAIQSEGLLLPGSEKKLDCSLLLCSTEIMSSQLIAPEGAPLWSASPALKKGKWTMLNYKSQGNPDGLDPFGDEAARFFMSRPGNCVLVSTRSITFPDCEIPSGIKFRCSPDEGEHLLRKKAAVLPKEAPPDGALVSNSPGANPALPAGSEEGWQNAAR